MFASEKEILRSSLLSSEMSSYSYMSRGYSTQNGVESYVDDWNKSIHSSSSDHVFWPVLIDAEGRKMPIISYNSPNNKGEYYVSETETFVHSTINFSDYKPSLPTSFEPVMTYGSIADETWSRPSSLVQRPVEDKWNTHTEPVNGFPKKVNELTNKVQSESVFSPCNLSPVVSEYKNSSITKVEPLGTSNGTVEKNLGRPSSTVEKSTVEKNLGRPSNTVEKSTVEKNLGRPSSSVGKNLGTIDGFSQKVDDYIKKVRASYQNDSTEEVEPPKTNGGVTEKKSNNPTCPVMHSEPVNGVPKRVDDFINKPQSVQNVSPLVSDYKQSSPTKVEQIATNGSGTTTADNQKMNEFNNRVQTEASRPRLGPLGATYWRQTAQVTPAHGYGGDLANKVGQTKNEPGVMISSGGWSRPRSHVTWTSPPEGFFTKPTNDINTAMEYLTEIAKPSPVINIPPGSQVAMPASTGFRTDGYVTTIDSREAARRYGNFNVSSRYPKNEAYTTTIDSREAARKYGGATV